MIRFDFREGSGIALGSDCFRFAERVRDKHRSPVFRHIHTDEPKTIPDREIEALLAKPNSDIRFLSPAEVIEAEQTGKSPKGPVVVFLDDIKSDWERKRAEKYEKYARGWDRAGRPSLSDAKLGPVIATVAREEGDDDPPSPRNLRRYLRTWVARGCTLEGLLTRSHLRGAKCMLPVTAREIALDVIWNEYLTLQQPAVTDCHETVKTRIEEANKKLAPGALALPVPSVRQFYREIEKIDKFTVMSLREGPRAALLKFGPRYAGVTVSKHNERWELDSTVADLMVIDGKTGVAIGRPTITVAIDCYSRTIVGFYIGWEAESFTTFVATMRSALQPKLYARDSYPEIQHNWHNLGVPEVIAVDNHSGYVSEECRAACAALGIDLQYTPVLKPWYRPIIERFFNTLTHKVFQRVPGTTFSNIFERNEETPPETIAVATLDELRMVITRWIVDEYHYTRHRGINTVPALLLEESMRLHATAPPPSSDRMDVALAEVVERVPQHYGIEWNGLIYNSPSVANVRIAPCSSRKVRIAVNPNDISYIRMHDPEQGWLRIPLVKPQLAPGQTLSFGQHSLIKQLLETRTEEFVGNDSYQAAHDYVARYVEGKRTSGKMADRRRAARHQFTSGPRTAKASAPPNEQGSRKIVTDDIFGEPGEPLAAPVEAPPAAPQVPDNPGTAAGALGEVKTSTGPDSTHHQDSTKPVPPSEPDRSNVPATTGGSVFVAADGSIDLKAAAAKLGITTHKG